MSAGAGTLDPGAIFGRDFRILRALREGGMGAVYVVEQLSTGKERALKVMASQIATDPATRERFVLEARAASRIDSDHVVEIVTAGIDEESGSLYIVMELLRGEELADALDRVGRLSLGDVAEILSQVGHALSQAHALGIVHRDLKPENIFLAASRRTNAAFTAKVLDFGIAKLVADAQKTGTQPLGTPLFMPPEQTDSKGRIAPASDVWALGLITFKLLTGWDFWREADGSLPMLLREIVVDPIPGAMERATEIGVQMLLPEGFDAWFGRCVNRDMDARFPEAGAAVASFLDLVPPDSRSGVLQIEGGGSLGASGPILTTGDHLGAFQATGARRGAPVEHAATVAGTPAFTTGSAASVTAPPVVAPQKGSGAKIAVAVLALAALGGGGFALFASGGDAPTQGGSATPTPTVSASASAAAVVEAPAGQCPEGMVFLKGGPMIMGSKGGSEDAKITHKVTLAGYCLDKTEVTAAAYESCVGAVECEKAQQDVSYPGITEEARARLSPLCNSRRDGRETHPINCVDFKMASAYCAWKKARLPTEAEWEYAARGSTQRTYPWGDDPPNEKRLNACGAECMAWGNTNGAKMASMYEGDDGFPGTAPVGTFPEGASSAGIVDLAGNVWEWTSDWYGPYSADEATDPKGPAEGTERVVRGGAFNGSMADWAKPAYRWKSAPETYNHAIGFRCAADPR